MSKLKQLIETANRKCEMAWKVYAFNPAKDNELAEESPVFQCIKKAAEYKREVAEKHPDYIVEIVAESRQKNESWTDIYPILGNIGEKRYMNKQKELPRDLMEKEFRKALKDKGLKPTEHDIEYALYKYYEYYDESSQKNENSIQDYRNFVDIADKLEKKLGKPASDKQLEQAYTKAYPSYAGKVDGLLSMYHRRTDESSQKNEDFRPDDIIPQSKQMDFKKQYMKNKDKRKVSFYFDGIHAVDDQSGSNIPGAVLGMKYKDLAAALDKFFESAQKNETKHIYNEKGFVFEWDTNTGVIKTLKKPTNGYNLEYRSNRLLGETSEGIKLARSVINAHIKRIKEQPILT